MHKIVAGHARYKILELKTENVRNAANKYYYNFSFFFWDGQQHFAEIEGAAQMDYVNI